MHVCLFCQSLSWYVLFAAVKTWLGCCLSCSCPLTTTLFLGENAVWSLKSPPAPPSSCFVSFHLVSYFALLSPMFSFGMTQLDVFKLKWKKKGCGVSPLQARGSYHWSKDHRGWVSFTQTVPRLPRLIHPLAASVAEAGPGCPSMSSVCPRSE